MTHLDTVYPERRRGRERGREREGGGEGEVEKEGERRWDTINCYV